MKKLEWSVLPIEEAWQRMERGGMNWLLFPDEEFRADDFRYWTGYQAHEEEIAALNEAIEELDYGHALDVTLKGMELEEWTL